MEIAMNELTPRQQDIFNIIADLVRRGRPPLSAELMRLLKFSHHSGLTNALVPLTTKGFIEVEGGVRGRQRIITLTAKGRAAAQMGIPVLGRIAAGPMIVADSEISEWIDPGDALLTRKGDFFLPIAGDSMIGDGILHGDKALIRPNVIVDNGEIAAVAQVQEDSGGEHLATLKHVYYTHGQKTVRLKASNPAYEDLILPAKNILIGGAYRGLLRQVD
jgi:repressor LexA